MLPRRGADLQDGVRCESVANAAYYAERCGDRSTFEQK